MTEENNTLAKIIMQQIMSGSGADGSSGKSCWMSWGSHDTQALEETSEYRGGLVFRTQGFKHKGKVFVWLSWMDTYVLEFLPDSGDKTVIRDVYFDNLTFAIDRNVEYTSSYEEDVKEANKNYTLGELFG